MRGPEQGPPIGPIKIRSHIKLWWRISYQLPQSPVKELSGGGREGKVVCNCQRVLQWLPASWKRRAN